MHPDLVYDMYRYNVATWEREARVRRLLADGAPKRRRRFHLGLHVPRRSRGRHRTVSATAHPCR